MTKSEIRKARKEARDSGRPWNAELSCRGHLETVLIRTRAEERKHARAMERWARRYNGLNGAPESWEDR